MTAVSDEELESARQRLLKAEGGSDEYALYLAALEFAVCTCPPGDGGIPNTMESDIFSMLHDWSNRIAMAAEDLGKKIDKRDKALRELHEYVDIAEQLQALTLLQKLTAKDCRDYENATNYGTLASKCRSLYSEVCAKLKQPTDGGFNSDIITSTHPEVLPDVEAAAGHYYDQYLVGKAFADGATTASAQVRVITDEDLETPGNLAVWIMFNTVLGWLAEKLARTSYSKAVAELFGPDWMHNGFSPKANDSLLCTVAEMTWAYSTTGAKTAKKIGKQLLGSNGVVQQAIYTELGTKISLLSEELESSGALIKSENAKEALSCYKDAAIDLYTEAFIDSMGEDLSFTGEEAVRSYFARMSSGAIPDLAAQQKEVSKLVKDHLVYKVPQLTTSVEGIINALLFLKAAKDLYEKWEKGDIGGMIKSGIDVASAVTSLGTTICKIAKASEATEKLLGKVGAGLAVAAASVELFRAVYNGDSWDVIIEDSFNLAGATLILVATCSGGTLAPFCFIAGGVLVLVSVGMSLYRSRKDLAQMGGDAIYYPTYYTYNSFGNRDFCRAAIDRLHHIKFSVDVLGEGVATLLEEIDTLIDDQWYFGMQPLFGVDVATVDVRGRLRNDYEAFEKELQSTVDKQWSAQWYWWRGFPSAEMLAAEEAARKSCNALLGSLGFPESASEGFLYYSLSTCVSMGVEYMVWRPPS